MASVELHDIRKSYPGAQALDGIDLQVCAGEFFTLLGPSGCGKTTLLRTVAGFVRQDRGEIHFDGRSVDTLPAYRRDTGMVFQDYAIFPHLSVGENVAFGLRNRNVARAERVERVAQALRTVRLTGYAERMPHELSGGQQQRVGLARAMVIRPGVLLMDEPLSNLDAKLRVELREDIRDIQRELGITTLYVTHDQEEALVVSDRVCVMRAGSVEQIGTPWDIYRRPATRFVAAFVGAMNFIAPWPPSWPALEGLVPAARGDVVAAIRPEDVRLGEAAMNGPSPCLEIDARVVKASFTGRDTQYTLHADPDLVLAAQVARNGDAPLAAPGERMRVALPVEALQLFDAGTGRRV